MSYQLIKHVRLVDLNNGPTGYEPVALTGCAKAEFAGMS